jgi:hypothetical protein
MNAFFSRISVCISKKRFPRGPDHNIPTSVSRQIDPPSRSLTGADRVASGYNQLQGVMPLLRDIVQLGKVEEGSALYAPSSLPFSDTGPRYRFEKWGKESWAVLDSRKGDVLLALVKYKKGAESLIERLEAYERCIAHMAVVNASPQPARAAGRPAIPAPP